MTGDHRISERVHIFAGSNAAVLGGTVRHCFPDHVDQTAAHPRELRGLDATNFGYDMPSTYQARLVHHSAGRNRSETAGEAIFDRLKRGCESLGLHQYVESGHELRSDTLSVNELGRFTPV